MSQQIDWSGIRAAAVAIGSVRDAAMRAAIALPPDQKARFVERVNKRAYRERWLKYPSLVQATVSKRVQTDQTLAKSVQTGAAIIDGTTLSRLEKRQFLAKVVRTPLADIDSTSPLCSEDVQTLSKEGSISHRIKAHDKLRALEIDAKMQGELESNSGAPTVVLNLGFFGGDVR